MTINDLRKMPKVAPTYYYCPFLNTEDCSGTCSGICPDGTEIRCTHWIEAEINRKCYYENKPMIGKKKTLIYKETND